jgi:hypothetical protein
VRSTADELDIVGADPQGAVVARVHLRTGMVTPEDWDAPTSGRELTIEILGYAYPPFVSGGLAPLTLPLTSDLSLNTLVLDPFVAQILSGWGIAYADHARAGAPEVGYAQCSETTVSFETPCTVNGTSYGPLSTCYDYYGASNGYDLWYQKVVCNDPSLSRAERLCVYPATAGVTTECGLTGPRGCVVCSQVGYGGGTHCLSDSCEFVSTGGSCRPRCQPSLCFSDADCCSCGYCGPDGSCIF